MLIHDPVALQEKGKKADFIVHDDRSLLALQGPAAPEALQPHLKDLDLKKFYFSDFTTLDIAGIPCWLTRTGYVSWHSCLTLLYSVNIGCSTPPWLKCLQLKKHTPHCVYGA